jgi:ribosomal protein S18 acetylase RimI-like enzyme
MDVGARLEFRELSRTEIEPAVRLLSRGMCDNPILVQAFGPDPEKRQRRLARYYAQVVPFTQPKGGFLGAFAGGTLVGVMGTLRPGCCQPGLLDVLRFVPSLLANNTPAAALRVKRWQDAWARHDPREDHWHVGLVAVESDLQGRGVGTRLVSEHCTRMDVLGAASYLETDKAINVRFYQKFGFQIVGSEPVLGVTNWFMKRPARGERQPACGASRPQSMATEH